MNKTLFFALALLAIIVLASQALAAPQDALEEIMEGSEPSDRYTYLD